MTAKQALEALNYAYEARDVAEAHAVAAVRREYAGIIALRQQQYKDAARREQEADTCNG